MLSFCTRQKNKNSNRTILLAVSGARKQSKIDEKISGPAHDLFCGSVIFKLITTKF